MSSMSSVRQEISASIFALNVVCVTLQTMLSSVSVQSKKVRLPVQNLLKLNS